MQQNIRRHFDTIAAALTQKKSPISVQKENQVTEYGSLIAADPHMQSQI